MVPVFKDFELEQLDQNNLEYIFKNRAFGRVPISITVTHFGPTQNKAVQYIEEYVLSNKISLDFPYPVYIISDLKNYTGKLNIIRDKKDLPKFFKRKERPASNKEQAAINRNELKAKKLISLSLREAKVQIKKFSSGHREMFLKTKEGRYLEQLLNKVRNSQD